MVTRSSRLLLLCALAVHSLHLSAANIMVNGSFESSLTGWTVTNDGSCVMDAYQEGDTTGGFFGIPAPAPSDGSYLLVTDPTQPGTCSIHQDVAIPPGATATLTADVGYLFDEGFTDATGCSVTVAVTTTGGSPIATVFSQVGGTTNIPLATQPTVNLSAQAGTTVRVIATASACGPAPVGLLMDNVILEDNAVIAPPAQVPVMPAWLMLVMVALLGATGLRRLRA